MNRAVLCAVLSTILYSTLPSALALSLTFGNWSSMNTVSQSAPALATYRRLSPTDIDRIWLIARGQDNQIWYRFADDASGTWSAWNKVPGGFRTKGQCGAVSGVGVLHL